MANRSFADNEKYKQVGATSEVYSDLLHTFLPHPHTRQITRRTNVDAVKMAIRNLILTNKYERIRQPNVGGNINRYLFEPFTSITEIEVKQNIENIIRNHEPRAQVIDVVVKMDEDNHMIDISIKFSVVTVAGEQQLDLTLYRVR